MTSASSGVNIQLSVSFSLRQIITADPLFPLHTSGSCRDWLLHFSRTLRCPCNSMSYIEEHFQANATSQLSIFCLYTDHLWFFLHVMLLWIWSYQMMHSILYNALFSKLKRRNCFTIIPRFNPTLILKYIW